MNCHLIIIKWRRKNKEGDDTIIGLAGSFKKEFVDLTVGMILK